MKTPRILACTACGSFLRAGSDDYAIDQHGFCLCTLCWILAVDLVPQSSGLSIWWTGRRVLSGVPGTLTAWQILDGEIQPRVAPLSFKSAGRCAIAHAEEAEHK